VRNRGFADPTTTADRRLLRAARAEAREQVWEIRRGRGTTMRDAFQREIGATVRSASPFLVSLVASEGLSVDELVHRIEPSERWPRSPSLSRRADYQPVHDAHANYVIHTASGWQKAIRLRGLGHRISFMRSGDDWAHLEVVDHSLELEARIGRVKMETLFGTLRIHLDDPLPQTLAAACAGRLVEDIVDHVALRGRGWLITEVLDTESPLTGPTLVVATGSTAYRMPLLR